MDKTVKEITRETATPSDPQIAVHNNVTDEAMTALRELLATFAGSLTGEAAMAVIPGEYHGHAVTMIARVIESPNGKGTALLPLAMLLDGTDTALTAMGMAAMRGDGSPVAPVRQPHDGVPLVTGQYL